MAAAEMTRLLASEDPISKVQALQYFAGAGSFDAACGDGICKCLANDDMLVRGAAARALASAAGDAVPMAGKVAELLASGDTGAKCAAAEVLGALASSGAKHAEAIAALLSEEGEDTSSMLASACVAPRPKASLRIPKCAAAEALPKLGASGRAFADAVAKLLGDKLPEVRCAAVASLGAMGTEGAGHEAVVLRTLAGEKDPRVIAASATSLAEMGRATGAPTEASLQAILKLFASQHPSVRGGAARALGAMGDAAVPHAGKLVKCLSDRSPQVKIAAMGALAEMGAAGQVYAADLARLAHDDWQLPSVRAAALDALSGMGDRGAAFEDDVAELLGDEEEEVREAASRALDRFGSYGSYEGYYY